MPNVVIKNLGRSRSNVYREIECWLWWKCTAMSQAVCVCLCAVAINVTMITCAVRKLSSANRQPQWCPCFYFHAFSSWQKFHKPNGLVPELNACMCVLRTRFRTVFTLVQPNNGIANEPNRTQYLLWKYAHKLTYTQHNPVVVVVVIRHWSLNGISLPLFAHLSFSFSLALCNLI